MLPEEIAREIERAAWVLTRVSALPYGTAAWKAYQRRFYERYGIGTMVPLKEVVADSGTGYPRRVSRRPGRARAGPALSVRDDTLVRLAQAAVLDGRDEVVLTDELIAAMDIGPAHPRVPPHLEVGVRVHAASAEELQRGRFRLEVVSVSRGVGVTTGRFLSVLAPKDRECPGRGAGRPPGRGRQHRARAAVFPTAAARRAPMSPAPHRSYPL